MSESKQGVPVFAVFDSKVGEYMNQFNATNPAQAIRSMVKVALDPTHDFHQFGGDYTLFEIGYWNSKVGQTFYFESKINHGTALQHLAMYQAQQMAEGEMQ